MLASRLDGNERSRARASYAIRSVTSEEHWLEIDSTSVDNLVGSPLPRVERQIDNFLKWMSYKLGDDHFGTVQLPDNIDHLAGVVGVVDGKRIEAVMSAMQNEGLIERPLRQPCSPYDGSVEPTRPKPNKPQSSYLTIGRP